MRRNSRDLAFKLIYESFFTTEIDFSIREDEFENASKEEFDYAIEIFEKYKEQKTEILSKIEKNLKNYTIDRIYKLDLALLCLIIIDIDYFSTPIAISVNEGIELAKIYSTEKSPKFLNGIIKTIYGEVNDWQGNFCFRIKQLH